MRRLLLLATGLGACSSWYDPADCRVDPEGCAWFQPQGLLCGLMHAMAPEDGGATCEGHRPFDTRGPSYPACPEGYVHVEVVDDNASWPWRSCAALGNAETSSADLLDVPTGSACGINSTQQTGTSNLCLGMNPLDGGCPDGFELRYGRDMAFDDGAYRANVLAWCELRDGCATGACAAPTDHVCGLTSDGLSGADSAIDFWSVIPWDTLSPGLRAALEADEAAGIVPEARCGDLPSLDGCPDGYARVCLPDRHGSSETGLIDPEALCWCSPEESVFAG